MLTIRQAQMATLGAAARQRFEDKILDALAETFDRQYAWLGRAQMREVVRLGITRAGEYGIAADRPVLSYVSLMLMLGAFFDDDPQLPWARAALLAPARGSTARVDRLYDETMDYLDGVAGPDNEHLVKALVRLSELDPATFEAVPAAECLDALVTELGRLYPQKAEAQGAAATRAAVVATADSLARKGIRSATGTALGACCAFMLGAGFALDPQVPWAARALALPLPEADKIARLYLDARAYVAFGLGR